MNVFLFNLCPDRIIIYFSMRCNNVFSILHGEHCGLLLFTGKPANSNEIQPLEVCLRQRPDFLPAAAHCSDAGRYLKEKQPYPAKLLIRSLRYGCLSFCFTLFTDFNIVFIHACTLIDKPLFQVISFYVRCHITERKKSGLCGCQI